MKKPWVQLRNLRRACVLLILPCNAAACVGNYFRAEVYNNRGWNTWREADANLQDLRREGRVAFAAFDSSILETKPGDPRGTIVFETEMNRATNPDGEDWGAPSWRWFHPTPTGSWKKMIELTKAATRGVLRVNDIGFDQVFALVNPRAYFLALAVAVRECNLLDRWVLFRTPTHPRFLIKAVKEISHFVRTAATRNVEIDGGIYVIPNLYTHLRAQEGIYHHILPRPWRKVNRLPSLRYVNKQWELLSRSAHHPITGGVSL